MLSIQVTFFQQNVFLHYQKLFQECHQQQVRIQLLQEQQRHQRQRESAILMPQHPILLDAVASGKTTKTKNGNASCL